MNILNKLSYGLFVLSVHFYKRDNACIINTVAQVANDPARIMVSVSKSNLTNEMLGYTDEFTLSILSEEADFEIFRHFGFASGKDTEKFENYPDCRRVENGAYAVTKGTNGYLCAKITDRIDLGSHTLFIAEITAEGSFSDVPSATYSYYHEHIKPKPAEKKTEKTVWRCKVCGYELEGEELPEGFTCPLCKHGAEDFEKV